MMNVSVDAPTWTLVGGVASRWVRAVLPCEIHSEISCMSAIIHENSLSSLDEIIHINIFFARPEEELLIVYLSYFSHPFHHFRNLGHNFTRDKYLRIPLHLPILGHFSTDFHSLLLLLYFPAWIADGFLIYVETESEFNFAVATGGTLQNCFIDTERSI